MDTKKLRQKILDLAIHGKLVPQDPNDEPASVLLERIRAEKERLIAEGKIKRSKKSATSDTSHYENVSFELPEGWCWVKIRDLCYYLGGYAFKSTQYVASSDNQVIRIGNVKDDKILLESQPVFITDDYAVTAESALLKNNDLLFTMTGTKGKRDYFKTSLVRVGKKRLFLNQRVGCLRSYSTHVYMEYLCLAMKHKCVLDAIFQTETGNVSQGNIGSENTLDLLIPLPPLNEQKRIVQRFQDCISDIDSVELNTIELKKVIERLKSKILDFAIHGKLVPQDANDKPASELLKRINPKAVASCDNPHYENVPFEIPDNWVWVRIDEINKFKSKTVNPQNSPTDQFELYSVPTFDTGEPEFPYGKDVASSKVEVEEGDVLLCKINPHLNRVWRVKHRMAQMKLLASSEWIVIRANEIIPEYLVLTMQSPYFRELMMSNVSGVGGSLMRAQPTFVKQYMIPIPPMQEQKRIVEKIQETFYMLHSIADSLN